MVVEWPVLVDNVSDERAEYLLIITYCVKLIFAHEPDNDSTSYSELNF